MPEIQEEVKESGEKTLEGGYPVFYQFLLLTNKIDGLYLYL